MVLETRHHMQKTETGYVYHEMQKSTQTSQTQILHSETTRGKQERSTGKWGRGNDFMNWTPTFQEIIEKLIFVII